MSPHTASPLLVLPLTASASWQADMESGQGDAMGIVLFFYAFLVYVIVKDAFKESRAKGWWSLGACLFVGWLILTFKWAMVIALLVFLASFLAFCWEKLR